MKEERYIAGLDSFDLGNEEAQSSTVVVVVQKDGYLILDPPEDRERKDAELFANMLELLERYPNNPQKTWQQKP